MEISPIGYLLVTLGIILFTLKRKYLFYTTLFFIPFWNSSVLYIDAITFDLRIPMFFMALLILKKALDTLTTGETGLRKNKENFFLFIFLVFTGISVLMPILVGGEIDVYPISGHFYPIPEKIPLNFGLMNVTQFLYIVFAVLSFYVLVGEINSQKRMHKALDIIIILGVLVSITGIGYQALRLLNFDSIPVHFYSFLGGHDLSFQGKFLFGKIPSMYSISGEPGWTAFFLSFPFAIVGTRLAFNKIEAVSRREKVAFVIMAFGLLLSTSTTAYLGMLIYVVSLGFLIMLKTKPAPFVGKLLKSAVLGIVFLIVLFPVFSFAFNYPFFDFILNTQVAKLTLEHGSGPVRFHYIMENLKIFSQYPILGVGIGSNKSTAMMPALLSNTGLMGTIPFLLFNFYIFRKAFGYYLKAKDIDMVISSSLISAFITLFALMFIAKSIGTLYTTHYWLIMAMMSSIYILNPEVNKNENRHKYVSGHS